MCWSWSWVAAGPRSDQVPAVLLLLPGQDTCRRTVAPPRPGPDPRAGWPPTQSPVLPVAPGQFLFLTLAPAAFLPKVLSGLGMEGCPLLSQLQRSSVALDSSPGVWAHQRESLP